MINADKYKKNKFRKLIPTSASETDKLQKLTTIDSDKEPSRPLLTISQQMPKSSKQVGVEGVSERYKDKHFVFERRLKTISSLNERAEQPIKHSVSSVGQYKEEKENTKQQNRYNKLIALVEEFKKKTELISKAKSVEEMLDIGTHTEIQTQEEIEQKFDGLIEKTKLSAARLIFIYLQRQVAQAFRSTLQSIRQPERKLPKQNAIVDSERLNQKAEPVRSQANNCRNNLLNVSKFFGSA